jgi:hypothetical protein
LLLLTNLFKGRARSSRKFECVVSCLYMKAGSWRRAVFRELLESVRNDFLESKVNRLEI